MFLKKSSYDEFAIELEKNLQIAEYAPLAEKQAQQEKAIKHLLAAADILDEINLVKEASSVTQILERFAWEVPTNDAATSGLTPEKMVSNLEQKGWVFNADDGDIIDVADPASDETVEMQPDGELEVSSDQMNVADAGTVTTHPEGMAINPMNPINPGAMNSIASITSWPEGAMDPYGSEEVDLDIRHILKKSKW